MAPKKKTTATTNKRRRRKAPAGPKLDVEVEEEIQEALPDIKPTRQKNTPADIEKYLNLLGSLQQDAAEYIVDSIIDNAHTRYNPKVHLREVMVHLAQGKSMLETAFDMGFCINTINLWRREHEDFEKAVNIGKSLAEGWWQKQGRENISNPYFNQNLWLMNMANRYAWSRNVNGKEESVLENEMDRYDDTKKKYEGQKVYQGNIDASEVKEILSIIESSTNTGREITVKNTAEKESKKVPGVKIKVDKIHPKRKGSNT